MRKTVRVVLKCPHCGQEVRYIFRNPAYTKKVKMERIRDQITELQTQLEKLEKEIPQDKRAFKCPYKDCKKLVYAKITSRTIKLSKRVPKSLRILSEGMGELF